MSARVTSEMWIAAMIRVVETEGASAQVARRGAAQSGAVAIKVIQPGPSPREALSRALTGASFGDGRSGWMWLVGPDPAPEPEVDARLEKQARFDPDLWILEIEDAQGRHFLQDPIAE
ncbi:MAG: DUF1491 family protein [Pseudomonadota bacterium]